MVFSAFMCKVNACKYAAVFGFAFGVYSLTHILVCHLFYYEVPFYVFFLLQLKQRSMQNDIEYIPRKNSGAYALILTLFKEHQVSPLLSCYLSCLLSSGISQFTYNEYLISCTSKNLTEKFIHEYEKPVSCCPMRL